MMVSQVIKNPTDAEVENKVTLQKTREISQTTTWEHHFGAELAFSYSQNINVFVFSGEMSLSLTVGYDYTRLGHSQMNWKQL